MTWRRLLRTCTALRQHPGHPAQAAPRPVPRCTCISTRKRSLDGRWRRSASVRHTDIGSPDTASVWSRSKTRRGSGLRVSARNARLHARPWESVRFRRVPEHARIDVSNTARGCTVAWRSRQVASELSGEVSIVPRWVGTVFAERGLASLLRSMPLQAAIRSRPGSTIRDAR